MRHSIFPAVMLFVAHPLGAQEAGGRIGESICGEPATHALAVTWVSEGRSGAAGPSPGQWHLYPNEESALALATRKHLHRIAEKMDLAAPTSEELEAGAAWWTNHKGLFQTCQITGWVDHKGEAVNAVVYVLPFALKAPDDVDVRNRMRRAPKLAHERAEFGGNGGGAAAPPLHLALRPRPERLDPEPPAEGEAHEFRGLHHPPSAPPVPSDRLPVDIHNITSSESLSFVPQKPWGSEQCHHPSS